ncbi:hypothetical protein B808_114 [Fructilactobacillus florum 8D]|uniref:Uncharacterized protein n=2 Tax=Fructilactobacillus florum TaxID=640331 RepID=W9EMT6_9LACO|nr:hypothetical protein B807_426 [Fructilactobacillus florum 2F]ETO40959.1 hypothetical protein B808_114 [Fructilactobacillus florum 8D]KRM91183.1 hypothetical protein FC87_GL001111 [Fructilactobacillus florum DSM 22689 = JCM 16035]
MSKLVTALAPLNLVTGLYSVAFNKRKFVFYLHLKRLGDCFPNFYQAYNSTYH